MATTPRERLARERDRLDRLADEGTISTECHAALTEWATALDDQTVSEKYITEDGETVTNKPRTIEGYLRSLRITITDTDWDPLADDVDGFNDAMDHFHDEAGKSKATLATYQAAAESFYGYHRDLGVDPADIVNFTPDSSPRHDETDMFDEAEVDALRRACGETQNPLRNRALLELLIFTGQRITALLTLRVKDVRPDEERGLEGNRGYIYLNDEYEAEHGGLKGALRRGRKRPMFGARKYVRDWLDYHPEGDDPEAWVFIGDPSHWKTDPDDHWAQPSADHVLRRIADSAGVDKPVNAHNFRHYCATVLYRDYDIDRDTIRMLLGHVEGSSALEETYSHLFDQDYIHKAEAALGIREPDCERALTPDLCPTCGEHLESHWVQCPSCQEAFGPTEDFEERFADNREARVEEAIDAADAEQIDAYRAIIDAVEDPVALADEITDSTD